MRIECRQWSTANFGYAAGTAIGVDVGMQVVGQLPTTFQPLTGFPGSCRSGMLMPNSKKYFHAMGDSNHDRS
jgi:hypothetical protein